MTDTPPIRVMLVDDHDMVRKGLAMFLDTFEDLELVGEASGGHDAVRLADTIQPDVILMDLVMPDGDGVTATRLIREAHPEIQVIALTSFNEDELVRGALQAGAIGYLLKNATIDELAQAIRAARSGRPTLAAEAAQVLVMSATRPGPEYRLTERELEVLALLVEGLTNRQIAQRLTLSHSTIKFHVSSILSKLGASSRTEAVSLALQHRLVS
jgi:NarL family two-component system response regulator LiaR